MQDGLTVNGITPAEAAKFETLFMLLDEEGTGGINEDALADLMPRMGVFLSEEELHQYFVSVDSDGSGEIDFHEFLQLMSRHREASQLALLEGGRDCFAHLKSASTLLQVIRPDDTINWILDVGVLAVILFWMGIVTYEDVKRPDNALFALELKLLSSVILVLDVLRGTLTSITPEGADTLPIDSRIHARTQYLRSRRFAFDILAATPLDVILLTCGMPRPGRVLQHLRLFKFFVLPDLFRVTPRDTLSPSYAQFYFVFVPLCKMCFWAMSTVHILSMAWIIISPGDVGYIDSQYLVMYTLTTTGYGDVEVETDSQKIFCIFLFCCASVVTGLVVGKLVQYSQQADLQTDANRRMMETLAALNHLTIPQEFKEEVLAFQMHRLKHSNSLFNEAISGLPQVMQDRMALYARMKIVRQVPIFAKAQEICVAKLAQSLVNVFVPPEEYIVIAGEEGEEMFFLFHGMCGVTRPDGKWIATLKRGGVFGEVALLEQTRRSASIKSLTYCQLFRLDKAAFGHIVQWFPNLLETIQSASAALQTRIANPKRTGDEHASVGASPENLVPTKKDLQRMCVLPEKSSKGSFAGGGSGSQQLGGEGSSDVMESSMNSVTTIGQLLKRSRSADSTASLLTRRKADREATQLLIHKIEKVFQLVNKTVSRDVPLTPEAFC